MAQTAVPDLGIVLAFIREGQGWSQTRLAEAAGTTPKVINDYEHGRRNLARPRLELLLGHMAVPPERIDATLSCLAGSRASSRAPAEPGDVFAGSRRRIEGVSLRFGRLTEELVRGGLQLLSVEGQALHGLQAGELRWRRLKREAPTPARPPRSCRRPLDRGGLPARAAEVQKGSEADRGSAGARPRRAAGEDPAEQVNDPQSSR